MVQVVEEHRQCQTGGGSSVVAPSSTLGYVHRTGLRGSDNADVRGRPVHVKHRKSRRKTAKLLVLAEMHVAHNVVLYLKYKRKSACD